MVDRERIEGRLARVSPLRLLLTLLVPVASGVVFLIGNLAVGQVGWAIVWAVLLAVDVLVVAWWAWVRLIRRRDAKAFGDLSRRPTRR